MSADDSFWHKEDGKILLTVYKVDQSNWWEKLFEDDVKSLDLQKVEPENTNVIDIFHF